jgi:hypothetical protein
MGTPQLDPLTNFLDAVIRCLETENWYAALSLTLTLPDICGSLENPSTANNRERYTGWCKQWLEPLFTHQIGPDRQPKVFLSANDFYQARNSILHSGNSEIDEKKRTDLDRFEFFESGGHCNWIVGGSMNGVSTPAYLQLRVDEFCKTVLDGVNSWNTETAADAQIQERKAKLLKINKPGTVIGSIQWG